MRAYLTDFDSLVRGEQVCALFNQSVGCFIPFLASYSSTQSDYLGIQSIATMMKMVILGFKKM